MVDVVVDVDVDADENRWPRWNELALPSDLDCHSSDGYSQERTWTFPPKRCCSADQARILVVAHRPTRPDKRARP